MVAVVGKRFAVCLMLAMLVAACAPWAPAPVEDRAAGTDPRAEARTETRDEVDHQTPPPVYEVQRGDTLYSIAFRYGLDWRRVARWNRIEAPYTIRPGQELRLTRPPRRLAAGEESPAKPAPPADGQATPKPEAEQPEPESGEPEPQADGPAAARALPPTGDAPARSVRGVEWQWPTEGSVARPFDPSATRRGVGIAGNAGQPVFSAAAGEVVYSGTALIGYGELIIIKHSDTLLSAYGFNRSRRVEEGDRVGRGEQIAEMGRNDRDEEMLHFEVRRNGQPEDPLAYLPGR